MVLTNPSTLMNLAQKASKGVIWTGLSTGVVTILNFLILAILARLLSPSDFGLMGIVMIVINFALTITDLGLGVSVIQSPYITNEQLSTFFFLNILLGGAFCGIIYFSSGIIALFFKEKELVNLLRVLSFCFIIVSFGQSYRILLQKWLNFKALAKVEIFGIVMYGVSSISFALKGFGVWSLVYGFLVRQLAESILLQCISEFRPKFVFDLKKTKHLFSFGIYVFGERIINYFNRNLDYIIIGRFLGPEALGFYSLAYQLMLVPLSKVSQMIIKVAFPAFSMVQDDNNKIRIGYLKMVKYIALITFPMMAGLFIVAPEFINSIYGTKWQQAILVLKILCIVGAVQSIATTVGTILYAKGRPDIGFKWVCCAIIFYALSFVIGANWGIVGVALAYSIVVIISSPIIQNITHGLIDLKMKDFLKQFVNQTIGAIAIIVVVFYFKLSMLYLFDPSQLFTLFTSISIGIIAYTVVVLLKEKNSVREVIEILRFNKPEKLV